jgi:hypothetical protein
MGAVKNWTVSVSDSPASDIECDALILGLVSTPHGVEVFEESLSAAHRESFARWVGALSLTAGSDEARKLPAPDGFAARSVVLVGLA